jgi:hypothetical protein
MMRHLKRAFAAALLPRPAAGALACGVLLILGATLSAAEQQSPPATDTAATSASSDAALEKGFDPGEPTYNTPDQAGQALFEAVRSQNHQALHQILGAPGELLHTDAPAADQLEREQFMQKYGQMHRWVRRTDGSMVLHVGAENWPFPVPLVPYHGGWRFDPREGLNEVLFRRIGENELAAIDVCHALIDAHRGRLSAGSAAETSRFIASVLLTSQPVRFHGYEYRVLPQIGQGFAAVAYPAAYRSSGVMTFVVDEEDVVYELDCAAKSAPRVPDTGS